MIWTVIATSPNIQPVAKFTAPSDLGDGEADHVVNELADRLQNALAGLGYPNTPLWRVGVRVSRSRR